jgi:hypothetical protein
VLGSTLERTRSLWEALCALGHTVADVRKTLRRHVGHTEPCEGFGEPMSRYGAPRVFERLEKPQERHDLRVNPTL